MSTDPTPAAGAPQAPQPNQRTLAEQLFKLSEHLAGLLRMRALVSPVVVHDKQEPGARSAPAKPIKRRRGDLVIKEWVVHMHEGGCFPVTGGGAEGATRLQEEANAKLATVCAPLIAALRGKALQIARGSATDPTQGKALIDHANHLISLDQFVLLRGQRTADTWCLTPRDTALRFATQLEATAFADAVSVILRGLVQADVQRLKGDIEKLLTEG